MLFPFIVTPKPVEKAPSPAPSDCETLITHTNNLIKALKNTQNKLNAISSEPDEALLTIKGQVSAMLADAEAMKKKLNNIKANAVRKSNSAVSGSNTTYF